MNHIGLFEGFGGFSLAARWAGWKTVATCEIADFPRRVIQHHFPYAYHHKDIHDFNYETINNRISEQFGPGWRKEPLIITGGFPCQPYSTAGKRLGKEDDRHLWPQMLRVIQEFTPDLVVGENVSGIISWNGGLVFEEVQVDLEAEGYEVWPVVLPAASVNAPHRRDRVWFIAHTSSDRRQREGQGLEIEGRESKPGSSRLLERGSEGLCSLRVASHTTKQRLPISGLAGKSEFQEKNREGLDYRPEFICDATNPDGAGFQKKGSQQQTAGPQQYGELGFSASDSRSPGLEECDIPSLSEKKEYGSGCSHEVGNYWGSFPSQSPVCGGDDGFPAGMVLNAVSYPKWRNESIKGYGNAIVPQVAYEIFKVINKIEKLK